MTKYITVKQVPSESHGVKWVQFKRTAGVAPQAIAHGVYQFDKVCKLCLQGISHT